MRSLNPNLSLKSLHKTGSCDSGPCKARYAFGVLPAAATLAQLNPELPELDAALDIKSKLCAPSPLEAVDHRLTRLSGLKSWG